MTVAVVLTSLVGDLQHAARLPLCRLHAAEEQTLMGQLGLYLESYSECSHEPYRCISNLQSFSFPSFHTGVFPRRMLMCINCIQGKNQMWL